MSKLSERFEGNDRLTRKMWLRRSTPKGITKLEVVVICICLGVTFGLLMPATGSREAARRTQ